MIEKTDRMEGQVFELAECIQELGFFGNVFVRAISFSAKGQILPGHKHNYDHATFVGQGRVEVTIYYPDGHVTKKYYVSPSWFEVPAMARHQIKALTTPAVCFCVFAVRDQNGEVAEFVSEQHLSNQFFHNREGGGETAE